MSENDNLTERSIEEYVEILRRLCEKKQLDKFIEYAVFPHFKNLEYGARIDFKFPITAVVGPNGSGKSSILHALYGMPYRYSTSRFWFSTNLDPIEEGKEKGPNRYFYSHLIRDIGKSVETKKIRRKRNESYWEPARESVPDGMKKISEKISSKEKSYRAADRWYPTFRNPIYISFKYQFSAFDRAFHVNNTGMTLVERIEKIKKSAKKIDVVISGNKKSYKPGGVEAVFNHRLLNEKELFWVNFILGKKYNEARYIEHRLYEKEKGTSVIFQTNSEKYSEAFAGSGELAVVNLVTKLMNGNEHDLVLLDEPETSLHPGAQECLIKFLMWCVLDKKYQIVLSTHSPTISQILPKEGVFALLETDQGRTAISSVEHPHMVFNRIGHVPENKILVMVEDNLLLKLVEVALDKLEDWKKERLKFHVPASGGDEVFKYLVPIHSRENTDVHYILDGDKEAQADLDIERIENLDGKAIYQRIKDAYKCEPLHLGKSDKQECLEYVQRVQQRVHYLDAICPEIVFLKLIKENAETDGLTNEKAKDELVKILDSRKLGSSAKEQHTLFNLYLREDEDNEHVIRMASILNEISLS